MTYSKSIASYISSQSLNLNTLLDKIDIQLKESISKLPVSKRITLYNSMSKLHNNKLEKVTK